MEFMRRAKGSISIFLCIILLPMVTYSTMIIDASRMQVARTSIATAGDLAMNAALSEYEKVLQDMYGLFVLTENQDSFENQLQAYFTETLEGKITTTDKDLITGMSDEIVQAIINPNAEGKLNNLNNMLAMTVEEDAFDYVPIDGSTLANQAIMKRQIIEYMKYKGPVSLASTLLPKLDFLKDSSKQTEVVEMKVEYTKKLSSLEDACQAAWEIIEGYEDPNSGEPFGYNAYAKWYKSDDWGYENEWKVKEILDNTEKGFRDMSTILLMKKQLDNKDELTAPDYEEMKNDFFNELGIYNLANGVDTENKESVKDYLSRIESTFSRIVNLDKTSKNGMLETYVDFRYSGDQITVLDRNDKSQFTDHIIIREDINGRTDEIFYRDAPYVDDGIRNTGDDLEKLAELYNKQLDAYNKAKDALAPENRERYKILRCSLSALDVLYEDYKAAIEKYDSLCTAELNKLKNPEGDAEPDEEAIRQYQETMNTEIGNYNSTLNLMGAIFNEWQGDENSSYSSALYYDSLHGDNGLCNLYKDTNIYIRWAESSASYGRNELKRYHDVIEKMITLCTDSITALEAVITAIESTEGAKSDWQGKIGELSDGTTKSNMQSDFDSTTDAVKIEEVEKLIKVFEFIKKDFVARDEALHEVKFFEMKILDEENVIFVSTYVNDSNRNAVFSDLNSETADIDDFRHRAYDIMDNHYDDSEVYKLAPSGGAPIRINAIVLDGNDEYESYMFVDEYKDIASQKFYLTLKSICETKKPEMTDTQTQQIDTINQSAGGSDASGNDINSAANAEEPTEATTEADTRFNTVDIGQIYNDISAKSEENGLKADDDEGPSGDSKVKNVKISKNKDDYDGKANDSTDSLKEGKNLLKTIGDLGAKVAEYAYMEEYFTEMFTCRTDATDPNGGIVLLNGYSIPAPGTKTVEMAKMAKTVNRNAPWFGREIEYIIWGDSNMNSNWVKTDALLYTIRFALNAIYAFTSPEIQSFALQVATAIAGWTVIGVPIVQACITVALALAESAYDLVLLHKGEDVPIYKSVTTFVCSPTGIVSEAGKKVATKLIEKGTEVAKQAIDNKIDEITDKVGATLEEKKQAALDYVAEYTAEQANEINTTIANMSVIPLMNQLMPVATEIDKKTDAKKDDLKTAVEAAVGKAFDSITTSINDMPNDNIVRPLAQLVYTEDFKNRLKTEVSEYFTKEFDSATGFSAVNKLNELKAYLIDDTVDENSKGIISKEIWKYNDKINGAIKEKADALTEKIKGVTEETADNLKSVMHEGFDDMSAKLSGTVTKTLDEAAEKLNLNKVKDASASKGHTLNYKEYCKIFVLVKLAAGQEPKMLNRAAALIEANVRTANGTNNTEFHIVDGYTLVGIKSNVKMGTLFPWGVSVSDSSDTTGSVDMSLDLNNLGENFVTINYQAVNGY